MFVVGPSQSRRWAGRRSSTSYAEARIAGTITKAHDVCGGMREHRRKQVRIRCLMLVFPAWTASTRSTVAAPCGWKDVCLAAWPVILPVNGPGALHRRCFRWSISRHGAFFRAGADGLHMCSVGGDQIRLLLRLPAPHVRGFVTSTLKPVDAREHAANAALHRSGGNIGGNHRDQTRTSAAPRI